MDRSNRARIEIIFLDVCLLVGQIKLPTMYHYFQKKSLYVVPSFTKITSGRKFKSIVRKLHMERDDKNDTLQKVRPIIKMFITNIRRNYYPKTELCLDESVLSWRGYLASCSTLKIKNSNLGLKFMNSANLMGTY